MANTIPDGIYYPDANTPMNLDTILATMASSIANGLGKRVAKLETFIGCNIGLNSAVTGTGTVTKVTNMQVNAGRPQEFIQGVTVNAGTVTVPEDGMYTVLFLANFLPTGGAVGARVNTYVFVNGVQYNFSSGFGEPYTSTGTKYNNCNVTAIYNLKKNDQIDVRIATYDSPTQLSSATFSVALTSRTLS